MASPNIMNGTWSFLENVSFASVTLPASSVTAAKIAASAGIEASKLQHLHSKVTGQKNGAINVNQREGLHVVRGATGTVLAVKAYNITTASGSDTTTIDILKDGVSILSSVITLNAAATTAVQSGTISSASVVAGNKLEVNIVATGVGPGQGVFVQLDLEEAYT